MIYYGIGQSSPPLPGTMSDEAEKKTLMIQAIFWGIVLVAAAGSLPFSAPSVEEEVFVEEEDVS